MLNTHNTLNENTDSLDSLVSSLRTELDELICFESTGVNVQETRKQFDDIFLVDFDFAR